MVYSHNNATEQFPGDPQYNSLLAHNVKPKITWSNGAIVGSITSSNAGNKTAPSVSIPVLPAGTHFEVTDAYHHYNTSTTSGNATFTSQHFTPSSSELNAGNNWAEFNIGDHASCYGNIHRVYFDLEVKQTAQPDFIITKTSVPTPNTSLNPGNTISYTLTAQNTGNVVISTLSISDTLDTNLTYISGDPGVNHANGAISITVNNLAVGATASYSFTVKINDNTAGGSSVCNQAAATTGTITRTSNQICHPIAEPLSFDLQKTAIDLDGNIIPAGTPILSGSKFDYRITLLRTGGGSNLPINSLEVTDLLPRELLFVSSLNDNDISHSSNFDRVNVFLDFPIPPAGQTSSKTFRVEVKTQTHETQFCNEATAVTSNSLITSNTICHGINQNGENVRLIKRAVDLDGNVIPVNTYRTRNYI